MNSKATVWIKTLLQYFYPTIVGFALYCRILGRFETFFLIAQKTLSNVNIFLQIVLNNILTRNLKVLDKVIQMFRVLHGFLFEKYYDSDICINYYEVIRQPVIRVSVFSMVLKTCISLPKHFCLL